MKKIIMTAVVASAALLASGGALAQGYVGGAIGQSHLDVDCDGATTCDKSDIGFKLFGGYGFGNGLSVEGVYYNLGAAELADGPFRGKFKGYGFGVGLAGTHQFTPLVSGTARLGIASNTAKIEASNGFLSASDDETNTAPYFGLAVGFNVARGLTVEAGIDFTRFEYDGEKADTRLISVGLKYQF
jgi:OOP family OmpA-OmpF porin